MLGFKYLYQNAPGTPFPRGCVRFVVPGTHSRYLRSELKLFTSPVSFRLSAAHPAMPLTARNKQVGSATLAHLALRAAAYTETRIRGVDQGIFGTDKPVKKGNMR